MQRQLDGVATREEQALLQANQAWWTRALLRHFDELDNQLEDVEANAAREAVPLVIRDLTSELARVDAVLTELVGPPDPTLASPAPPEQQEPAELPPMPAVLQLAWAPGQLIAWAGGYRSPADDATMVEKRLADAAGDNCGWSEFRRLKLPDGSRVETLQTSITDSIGWLVAQAKSADNEAYGASVTWLGLVAAAAVQLVAQGRFVPVVKKGRRVNDDLTTFEVHWAPALIDAENFGELVRSMPAAVALADNRGDAKNMTTAILQDMVDAICRTAADRLEVPAPPPQVNNRSDFAEAILSALAGTAFQAPPKAGGELLRRLELWSKPVVSPFEDGLVLTLDPPDESNAWFLAIKSPVPNNGLESVESALVNSSASRRRSVQDQLSRLERLYPILMRPGGRRRGEVLLSQEEAWQLMTQDAPALLAAGYELRAPNLSRRKATPSLRLTADESSESVVGAQQLANVRWSVLFDDIELTAADIAELASQARPLVSSRGRWVEIDKLDLAEAAAALAERDNQRQLTGADMLRHALGLDGTPFSGGVTLGGDSWASDLLRESRNLSDDVLTTPPGFSGELRSYQAEARAWLGFLSKAGLGGCLALDMGLGKTPTMLANIAATVGAGPALVVAPPAVVGNWAAEAAKFVKGLKVKVHHGPNRIDEAGLEQLASRYDVIITTYGTAVRDIAGLEKVTWSKLILDEAQAIKNPASETSQQLRRLKANTRVALTGTPIENGLGDLWAIIDFCNPGLVGPRSQFIAHLSSTTSSKDGAEHALKALNGILVFRRTKSEPAIAAELPDRIDELDHCAMTPEQIGLYQAVIDSLVTKEDGAPQKKGAVLAAITALKQICNHPASFSHDDTGPLAGRSGKLDRLDSIVDNVFIAGERMLIFTHFATWGEKLAHYLTERTGIDIACYHGGLGRGARDKLVADFQAGTGPGAMVLSLKAGGTGLNLTAANHVVLYDRWWNPAVEDQARDRVWRIGQKNTVICHRLICPGTVDERVEEVVAGKRKVADLVLPKSSSIDDLDAAQLQAALGLDPDLLLTEDEVAA